MIAFDSDIWTEISAGNPSCVVRAKAIPRDLQHVPIVVAEESLRGWLDFIRKTEARKIKVPLSVAYESLEKAIQQLGLTKLLPYTPAAHDHYHYHYHYHYLRLKSQKLRIGTRDLRIASIALAHGATLITRNRRDFDIVPSLQLEVWN